MNVVGQTEQRRVAVEGRLVNGDGTCTVLIIREHGGWVLYPHGAAGMAVRIADPDAATLAATILGEDRVLIIREHGGWVLYPHSAAGMAVRLSEPDARALAEGIVIDR